MSHHHTHDQAENSFLPWQAEKPECAAALRSAVGGGSPIHCYQASYTTLVNSLGLEKEIPKTNVLFERNTWAKVGNMFVF